MHATRNDFLHILIHLWFWDSYNLVWRWLFFSFLLLDKRAGAALGVLRNFVFFVSFFIIIVIIIIITTIPSIFFFFPFDTFSCPLLLTVCVCIAWAHVMEISG
jgi:hypothetical protein